MIDEKKLIEDIKAECEINAGGLYVNEIIGVIHDQPKVGEWIPVSERLPEEEERVFVSTRTGVTRVGRYTKRYGFEHHEGFICEDGFMWMNTANAWMPLPEPYKGE